MRKQKKPVRVPVILQMEKLEGGAASLAMMLAYYGRRVPLEVVRVECGVSGNGADAQAVAAAGKAFGLSAELFQYSAETLRQEAKLPAVLLWDGGSFVVLNGFQAGCADLNDPAAGHIRIPFKEFEKKYSGVCVEFTPSESFSADGKKKTTLSYLRDLVRLNWRTMVLVMITSALAMAAGAVMPVITRTFTDEILSGDGVSWYRDFMLFFLGMIAVQFIASFLNQWLVQKSTDRLSLTSTVSFMQHLLSKPMEFFSQRTAGDLAGRINTNGEVASTLIGYVAPLLINLMMLVFYLVVMIGYSLPLTLFGTGAMLLNIAVARHVTNRRIELSRIRLRDKALLESVSIAGIDMIETIKASGAENGFMRQWSGYHAGMVRSHVELDRVNRTGKPLPELIVSTANALILLAGMWLIIMERDFTEGILLAFQGCMQAFASPFSSIIDSGQNLQEMRCSQERVDDVICYPESSSVKEDFDPADLAEAEKLSGRIRMEHVTFGYSKNSPPVLKDFSLSAEPGMRIAIVGASGSGKSTVAKLLSGLYQPWEGDILLDGKHLSEIPKPVFCGSVAMVDQDVSLFRDTVADNIRMWDETIEDYDVILAARDASIHDDIVSHPDGYRRLLDEDGRNLSGGQRQRLEIARTLAGDPSIVIMDEATSALDAITERDVSDKIHDRGITCIIIAHRLSTIRDCDEIIVLDHGVIVQRGRHEELAAQEGAYRKLVSSQ